MVLGKKGDEKWYIIISLILGLAILFISLYWIFNEYFTEDDISWETCRQSIIARSMAPNLEDIAVSTKGSLALKCKTELVEIEELNRTKAYKTVSDMAVACWNLYGEGELEFIDPDVWENNDYCMVCARIRFKEDVVEEWKSKFPRSYFTGQAIIQHRDINEESEGSNDDFVDSGFLVEEEREDVVSLSDSFSERYDLEILFPAGSVKDIAEESGKEVSERDLEEIVSGMYNRQQCIDSSGCDFSTIKNDFSGDVSSQFFNDYLNPEDVYDWGFHDFYLKTPMRSEGLTYAQYLPISMGFPIKDHFSMLSGFSPEKKDYLIVYTKHKIMNAGNSVLNNDVTRTIGKPVQWVFNDVSSAVGSEWRMEELDDEKIKELEDGAKLILVESGDLNKLGCGEILTVPA